MLQAPAGVMALMSIGTPFEPAVRCVLDQSGETWASVAMRHGLHAKNFSRLVNGSVSYPMMRYRDALAAELGVSREWLDNQIERNGRKEREG